MLARSSASVPAVLSAVDISREVAGRVVLSNVSVTIGPFTRLGVVGPNGVGKSTLLRVLAGLDQPDTGRVTVTPPAATVGYMAQEPERSDEEIVLDHLRRVTGVESADAALAQAAQGLARGDDGADDAYVLALERWQGLGAADLEGRIDSVLAEVGLSKRVLELPTAALSGGEAARVALASVVVSQFDVVLLDEPTNDLDFDGLEILEDFVLSRQGATVIVSHDRRFLEQSITSTLEIDEHFHTAEIYGGGWSSYLDERAVARRHAEEAYGEYESRRRILHERAGRERQWATKGVARRVRRPSDNDKAQRDFHINRTERLAARARRTERALSRLEQEHRAEKPWEGWNLQFVIGEAPRSGAVVVRLDAAIVQRGAFQLGPVQVEIGWGERVGISGPNGSGKTTLVKALLGNVELDSGERWMGPSVVVGELGQDRARFERSLSLLRAFVDTSGLDLDGARSLLAKFALGPDHVTRSTASLSPGERTRAELALFQARGVNLMVLDEPTNHLDLPAVEQLEKALADYTGTLVLVTHDRELLEKVELHRTVHLARR